MTAELDQAGASALFSFTDTRGKLQPAGLMAKSLDADRANVNVAIPVADPKIGALVTKVLGGVEGAGLAGLTKAPRKAPVAQTPVIPPRDNETLLREAQRPQGSAAVRTDARTGRPKPLTT